MMVMSEYLDNVAIHFHQDHVEIRWTMGDEPYGFNVAPEIFEQLCMRDHGAPVLMQVLVFDDLVESGQIGFVLDGDD